MFELETLSDVIALLKTKECRDNGVEEKVFHRNGILSLEGVATELRHRGYEVEIFESRGGAANTACLGPVGGRAAAQKRPALLSRPTGSQIPRPIRRGRLISRQRNIQWPVEPIQPRAHDVVAAARLFLRQAVQVLRDVEAHVLHLPLELRFVAHDPGVTQVSQVDSPIEVVGASALGRLGIDLFGSEKGHR